MINWISVGKDVNVNSAAGFFPLTMQTFGRCLLMDFGKFLFELVPM